MTRVAVAIIGLLIAGSATANAVDPPTLDTTIRVLVVRDADVNQNFVNTQIAVLENAYTNARASHPITMTIANPGTAISVVLPQGDAQTQVDLVRSIVNASVAGAPTLREIWAADIVVAFTDKATVPTVFGPAAVCGLADSGILGIWLGPNAAFAPAADGVPDTIDVRGSQDAFIGLVSNEGTPVNCNTWVSTAAHEVGHLAGGAHWATPDPGTEPLNDNARADRVSIPMPFGPKTTFRTAITSAIACVPGDDECVEGAAYSNPLAFGNPDRQNIETINQTAQSMANYFPGGPMGAPTVPQCSDGIDNDGDSFVDTADTDCTGPADDNETGPPPPPAPPSCNPLAYAPTNVTAQVSQVCVHGTSRTAYRVRWQHACPGGFYEVWGTTAPEGTYYVTGTQNRSTTISIGPPALTGTIRIRACIGFSCSAFSSPPVTLVDQC